MLRALLSRQCVGAVRRFPSHNGGLTTKASSKNFYNRAGVSKGIGKNQPTKHAPPANRPPPTEPNPISGRQTSSQSGSQLSAMVRPTLCAAGVVASSFTGAVIWQYESRVQRFTSAMNNVNVPWDDHWQAKTFSLRNKINSWVNTLDSHDKLFYSILAVNSLVFCMWRVPGLGAFMQRYFLANLAGPAPSLSMIGCMFSHSSLIHLGLNMYVLHSFMRATKRFFTKEETAAVYMSGGAISSWGSYALSALMKTNVHSLGASGAILTILAVCCMQNPDSQLSIVLISEIFPHSFNASTGLKGIMAFDLAGILMGWKIFDHAAHLSGALFGVFYLEVMRQWFWKQPAHTILKRWRKLRGHDRK